MSPELTNTTLTMLATLIGALVAGVISFIAGRSLKTHEWKLAVIKETIATRRRIYAEFLSEADRLMMQSIEDKIDRLTALNELTTKFSEISLLSPDPVIEAAKVVFDAVISAHARDSKSVGGRNFYKDKQNFIAAAKKEIASYKRR
jgi:hypothetical protein